MSEPVSVYRQVEAFARPMVEPLFLQDFLLRTGRSSATSTATGTFVRRGGTLYCVTCRHVVQSAASETRNPGTTAGVLAFAHSAGAIVLGSPKQSCFACPAPEFQQPAADIALARIPWGDWETLKSDREQLSFIDFDEFKAPDYGGFVSCAAVGFPDRMKVDRDGRIKANIAVAVAGVTRPIGAGDDVFQLHSELSEAHGIGFSGMSGGVVAGIAGENEFVPIGIVFQGGPSGTGDAVGAIAGPRDIFFRCYLLTPARLDAWIERTTFPAATPIFMAVV